MAQKLHNLYPLIELSPFIECLEILHTCLRVLRATFDQLMKRLRTKKLFWISLTSTSVSFFSFRLFLAEFFIHIPGPTATLGLTWPQAKIEEK